MFKLMTVVLVGLTSSIVFADTQPENYRPKPVSYECKFESKADCGGKKTTCWVEGLFCNETDHFLESGLEVPVNTGGDFRRCHGFEEAIKIKCSNGMDLFSRDAAVEIDNNTLWINAEENKKIATLRVEDFFKRNSGHEFWRKADLLISEKYEEADRLTGTCEFKTRGRHSIQ